MRFMELLSVRGTSLLLFVVLVLVNRCHIKITIWGGLFDILSDMCCGGFGDVVSCCLSVSKEAPSVRIYSRI